MKRFSQQFKKQGERITLRASEKAELKARLISYMEYHPLPAEMVSVATKKTRVQEIISEPFFAFNFNKVYTQSFAGVFAVMFIMAVPLVAERTLPGDVLYPVKVQFNEEVRATLAFSPYAKVEWETQRLERRISEARLLASEGRLTPEAEIAVAEAVKNHTDAAQREIATLRETDSDAAAIASIAFASALAVQSEVLEGHTDSGTGETTGDYSVLALADVVAQARTSAESAQTGSSLSYEKLLATVEQESTRVYELFESVKGEASADEVVDIERRLADVQRKVTGAIALKEGGVDEVSSVVTAMTMSMAKQVPLSELEASDVRVVAMKVVATTSATTTAAEDSREIVEPEVLQVEQVPQTEEQKKEAQAQAIASLRLTLTDIQKLLNYLSHIDVRENVSIEDLVPVVLTAEEKAREIIDIYDEVHAYQAKVVARNIESKLKAKVSHAQKDIDTKLIKVTSLMEKGNLDEARMLVEDARNIALDLVKITSNEPLKVEGVPEVAPVLPPATTTKTTLPQ